ncbi:hypothetical protein P8C59_007635 [Phyllachora maydis]|uniref:Uncharacterized protein n=1 Tax=Phyllachora maydis TaxID=1825666 RepID=A0AAD9I947_9PEZI|nr:hypothetical protein P8C59_007635 [Phyllachora maydis]
MLAKPAKVMPAVHSKKEGPRRSKCTAGSNAGRYTTDSSLMADKDDNNAYNRVYIPPTDIEEEEGSSGDDNSVNSGTSNSTDKGKGSGVYKRGEGALHCEACPVIARYLKVLIASKPTSTISPSVDC